MSASAPQLYLDRMESLKIVPNFWCSLEYWKRAGIRFSVVGDTYLSSDSDGGLFLPILTPKGPLSAPTWFAGFPGDVGGEILDHQYIYSPGMPDMRGTTWKPVRANVHRVERALGPLRLEPLKSGQDLKKAGDLLLEWALDQEGSVYDPGVMADYILNGDNRLALRDEKNVLWGVLAWDSNYQYTNFRYCVVAGSVDGLSDVARLLFREWCGTHYPHRLINDGGDLDRPGLRRYKLKFHPTEVHIIRGKAT